MVRKSERKYYGVNVGLTPIQQESLDKVRRVINIKIGVELSRAEIVQYLCNNYLRIEGHDKQA